MRTISAGPMRRVRSTAARSAISGRSSWSPARAFTRTSSRPAAATPETALGNSFRVTADLAGLSLRVHAIYQDADGTLENVYSAPTAAVAGVDPLPPATPVPTESATASPGNGLHFIRADLQFILDQIKIAERTPRTGTSSARSRTRACRSACARSMERSTTWCRGRRISAPRIRTSCSSSIRSSAMIRTATRSTPMVGAPGGVETNTNYATTTNVVDADPRIISNLISDQTAANLAAAVANGEAEPS